MASIGTIKYKNGSNWIDILHPVKSFYFSTDNTSPAALFGGTWTLIENRFLRGINGDISDSTHTGGTETHQHEWGLTYRAYYGAISTQNDNELIRPIRYDSNNNKSWVPTTTGTMVTHTQRNWGLDGQLYGYVDVTNMDGYGTTAYVSNLPPYMNCYIWYRTA